MPTILAFCGEFAATDFSPLSIFKAINPNRHILTRKLKFPSIAYRVAFKLNNSTTVVFDATDLKFLVGGVA